MKSKVFILAAAIINQIFCWQLQQSPANFVCATLINKPALSSNSEADCRGALSIKKIIALLIILLFGGIIAQAQSAAQQRADRFGAGMNLSYLDNYWNGTKQKHFGDFVKPAEVSERQKMLADIARTGFKTVRLPICFGAWASLSAPYDWESTDGIAAADSFVKWSLANNLNTIIDLHHTEFDGSIPGAATTERLTALWKRVAEHYKNTDPEKVFFEVRNEPHDVKPEDWRAQAEQLIKTIRQIAPRHTLIVGFHDWNSRKALIDSEPFADANIIYTFHYYDPFIFTHQGATWAGEGLPELKAIPFPWTKKREIKTPAAAQGKWVENQIKSYQADSNPDKMFDDLKAAKQWSTKHNVPIFVGELGSYGKYAAPEDRCRHAETVYAALGKLNIPSAWWEWDGGFNMFKPGSSGEITDCLRDALNSYSAAQSAKQKS